MIDSRIDPDPEPTQFQCSACGERTHYDDAAGWLDGVCFECGKKRRPRMTDVHRSKSHMLQAMVSAALGSTPNHDWKPIATVPRDERVLVYRRDESPDRLIAMFDTDWHEWVDDDGHYLDRAPTHYQLLPPPPKEAP